MCQTFIPLLRSNGRIVNVSSTGSSLSNYSESIQARFRSSKMTLDDLESLVNEFQESANKGTERQDGWPTQSYAVSKAAMNAMTATFAREKPGLVINSCCPGWVATDMGKMISSTPPKNPGMSQVPCGSRNKWSDLSQLRVQEFRFALGLGILMG